MASNDDQLDQALQQKLLEVGASPAGYSRRALKNPPVNTMGIPTLLAYDLPSLSNTNTDAFVLRKQSPGEKDRMYLSPKSGQEAVAHETEHLLAERGLGTPSKINTQFDKLIGNTESRDAFVRSAIDAAPYLKEKYGLTNAYFDPKMYKFQGPSAPNLLYEQLASLASIEATQGVDLTKDPVLRKTLFNDKNVRETYNALVGLRQTRLDAKDLPPHTRQPETVESTGSQTINKLKKLIGMAEGGRVDSAGNNKLI